MAQVHTLTDQALLFQRDALEQIAKANKQQLISAERIAFEAEAEVARLKKLQSFIDESYKDVNDEIARRA